MSNKEYLTDLMKKASPAELEEMEKCIALVCKEPFGNLSKISEYKAEHIKSLAPEPTPSQSSNNSSSNFSTNHYRAHEKKSSTGLVGLKNQGATCYLNSLIQSLYNTESFRKAIFAWRYDPKTDKKPELCVPLQIQRLFAKLKYADVKSVETTDLTASFGWDRREAWIQHDVQELLRVLFSALEKVPNIPIHALYQGCVRDYVKCLGCNFFGGRNDLFLDLQLVIRNLNTLEEAFEHFSIETDLKGENQFYCDKCRGKRDALKGFKLTKLPDILTLHLKRFDIDYSSENLNQIKLNNPVFFPQRLDMSKFVAEEKSFYSLHSILIHRGSIHSGHYFAYIRVNGVWYEFNDEKVSVLEDKEVSEAFGSEKSTANAYMLIYEREQPVNKETNELNQIDDELKLLDPEIYNWVVKENLKMQQRSHYAFKLRFKDKEYSIDLKEDEMDSIGQICKQASLQDVKLDQVFLKRMNHEVITDFRLIPEDEVILLDDKTEIEILIDNLDEKVQKKILVKKTMKKSDLYAILNLNDKQVLYRHREVCRDVIHSIKHGELFTVSSKELGMTFTVKSGRKSDIVTVLPSQTLNTLLVHKNQKIMYCDIPMRGEFRCDSFMDGSVFVLEETMGKDDIMISVYEYVKRREKKEDKMILDDNIDDAIEEDDDSMMDSGPIMRPPVVGMPGAPPPGMVHLPPAHMMMMMPPTGIPPGMMTPSGLPPGVVMPPGPVVPQFTAPPSGNAPPQKFSAAQHDRHAQGPPLPPQPLVSINKLSDMVIDKDATILDLKKMICQFFSGFPSMIRVREKVMDIGGRILLDDEILEKCVVPNVDKKREIIFSKLDNIEKITKDDMIVRIMRFHPWETKLSDFEEVIVSKKMTLGDFKDILSDQFGIAWRDVQLVKIPLLFKKQLNDVKGLEKMKWDQFVKDSALITNDPMFLSDGDFVICKDVNEVMGEKQDEKKSHVSKNSQLKIE